MGYIEFTDGAGRSWRVWRTVPEIALHRLTLAPDWKDGWLTFESTGEKRRLAPVPTEWESLPPQRLELLCRMAQPSTLSPQTDAMLHREERKRE
jgi:hypothetical protein